MATELVSNSASGNLSNFVAAHDVTVRRIRRIHRRIATPTGGIVEVRARDLIRSECLSRDELQGFVATLTAAVYHPSPAPALLGCIIERMGSLPRGGTDLGSWARHVVEILIHEEPTDGDSEKYHGIDGGFSAVVVHAALTTILATERWLPAPAAVLAACKAERLAQAYDLVVSRYLRDLPDAFEPAPDDEGWPPF